MDWPTGSDRLSAEPMYVIIVDICAGLLVIGGLALLAHGLGRSDRARREGGDPGTYARRIAGTMIAAFGLALGLMVTLFHFASG